jgi:GTPase
MTNWKESENEKSVVLLSFLLIAHKPVTYQVLVREMKEEGKIVDVRVAVCGNVDSGKSTMIGVLVTGEKDNGRGAARLNVFAHKHEIETGRTSCISEQIMGFDDKGMVVNYRDDFHSPTWADIANESCKVRRICLIDAHSCDILLRWSPFSISRDMRSI